MVVFLAVLLIWIFSLCVHEYAHARTAYAGGDRTVVEKGYLDFNPARYLDGFSSLVLPLLMLLLGGLALPGGGVWIETWRLRSRGWITAMYLAGPLANVACGIACTAPFWLGFGEPESTHPAWSILAYCAYLQFTAALLNLVPIPGLDGYGALEPYLPRAAQESLAPLRSYSLLILIALSWGAGLGRFIFTHSVGAILALGVPPEHLLAGEKAFFFWR
jgi:Zn-dependent protease